MEAKMRLLKLPLTTKFATWEFSHGLEAISSGLVV